MDTQTQLLADVESFMADAKMTPTAFGLLAVNDGKFVPKLRSRKNMTLATVDRVREFLITARAALPASVKPEPADAPVLQ